MPTCFRNLLSLYRGDVKYVEVIFKVLSSVGTSRVVAEYHSQGKEALRELCFFMAAGIRIYET